MHKSGSLVILIALTAMPALAVEGALGRTIPGVWVQPQGAVVGPNPGFIFSTIPIGYMGTIGGARLVPIGGTIYSNVDANVTVCVSSAIDTVNSLNVEPIS